MKSTRKFFSTLSLILVIGFCTSADLFAQNSKTTGKDAPIKAYCIDFNWPLRGKGFAAPGTWKEADPAKHVAWYKAVGANVIQTFAVSCNGYAWYKNGVVPQQPGLEHDFLTEVVKLGHAEGMKVMGYFCIASNPRWGKANPTLSYGTGGYHIPYTDEYLAYLSSAISDAVKKTGMDGFMVDWLWMPGRKSTNGKWIDAEKKLYKQLMGADFPGEDKLTGEQDLAYSRKAIGRAWKAIRKAAKEANPKCIIWLTANKTHHPHIINSDMYREVDWLMGESGKNQQILSLKPMIGKHTRLITCTSAYGNSDATKTVPEAIRLGIGVYGYAKPDHGKGGIIRLDKIFPKQLSELGGNHKRIGVLARAYRGMPFDAVWKDGGFVKPEQPLPFRIKLKKIGRGYSDTAKITFEEKTTVLTVNPRGKYGRAGLTRQSAAWPTSLRIRISSSRADRPAPTHFRIANGTVGMSLIHGEKPTVIAGETQESLELKAAWGPEKFLNKGNPEKPITIGDVKAKVAGRFAEVSVPAVILQGNPKAIAFEWCRGEQK